jgi:hypothetical protein
MYIGFNALNLLNINKICLMCKVFHAKITFLPENYKWSRLYKGVYHKLATKLVTLASYFVVIPAHPAVEVAAGLRIIDPLVTGSILDARIQLAMHNQALAEARQESWDNLVANLQDPVSWLIWICFFGVAYLAYNNSELITQYIPKVKLSLHPNTLNSSVSGYRDSVLQDYDMWLEDQMLQVQLQWDIIIEAQKYLAIIFANHSANIDWALYFSCSF